MNERLSFLDSFTTDELHALAELYFVAARHTDTGGGSTCAKLLLGLYNGERFPFDLTDLRRLDGRNLNHAMTVIRMDASRCRAEVHVLLRLVLEDPTVQARMECWAYDLGLKGRAKKADVEEQRAILGRKAVQR